MISAGFLITSFIVVVIPGTGVIYTITTSLSGSRRQAMLAALGCTLGILPHILAAVFGLSALLHTGAQFLRIIRIAGILYLTYLGLDLIRSNNRIALEKGEAERAFRIIGKAVLINLLNPKLTLFFFSFLPQFIVESSVDVTLQMLILSGCFMAITFLIFCLYGLLANTCKQFLKGSPGITRRIQQGFGVILLGFAGKLSLEEL